MNEDAKRESRGAIRSGADRAVSDANRVESSDLRSVEELRAKHGVRADHVHDWKTYRSTLTIAEVETLLCLAESLQPEIVICAAIRLSDGLIIRGHRHADCFHNLAQRDGMKRTDNGRPEQGFVTSRNRYVDRREGVALQLAAGISSADPTSGGAYSSQLYSEDLY